MRLQACHPSDVQYVLCRRGTHNELVDLDGAYAKLVQKQIKQRAAIVDADR